MNQNIPQMLCSFCKWWDRDGGGLWSSATKPKRSGGFNRKTRFVQCGTWPSLKALFTAPSLIQGRGGHLRKPLIQAFWPILLLHLRLLPPAPLTGSLPAGRSRRSFFLPERNLFRVQSLDYAITFAPVFVLIYVSFHNRTGPFFFSLINTHKKNFHSSARPFKSLPLLSLSGKSGVISCVARKWLELSVFPVLSSSRIMSPWGVGEHFQNSLDSREYWGLWPLAEWLKSHGFLLVLGSSNFLIFFRHQMMSKYRWLFVLAQIRVKM